MMSMGNLWVFPGGKVKENEDSYSALVREISEELGCSIETSAVIFNDNTHEYEAFIINLISIKAKIAHGTPIAREHSKLIWLKRENLASLIGHPQTFLR
ncbi:MAG: NUDIX domain-containing protein [Bacillota bacterium]